MAQTILEPVRVATTQPLDLTLTTARTIDGVSLAVGDRVLVKNQINKTENGVYTVQSNNGLSLATDFTNSLNLPVIIFVREGSLHSDTGWILINDQLIIGSTPIEFKRFTVNVNPQDIVGYAKEKIVLRRNKGNPLTNNELDNNFVYLSEAVDEKVRIEDYTGPIIVEKIKTLSTEAAALDVWTVRGLSPVSEITENNNLSRIVIADSSGNVGAIKFVGPLQGNADSATRASDSDRADTLTATLPISLGGTGATTASTAATNLNVVKRSGDSIIGRLVLQQQNPALNTSLFNIGLSNPSQLFDSDIWIPSDGFLKYRSGGVTHTLARLNSPNFTGTPTLAANAIPSIDGEGSRIASVSIVKTLKDDTSAALALKAPLASPTFTGTPSLAEGAIPLIDGEGSRIASVSIVKTLKDDTNAALALKASIEYVNEELALKADTLDVNAQLLLKAPLASPEFTGTPIAPTPDLGDDSTKIATTAFVDRVRSNLQASINTKANANATYTKDEIDGLLNLKSDDGDSYTKSESDNKFLAKVNAYNKDEIDDKFLTKQSAASTYDTISSVNSKLNSYLTTSTAASTYDTISSVNSKLNSYLTTSTAASTYLTTTLASQQYATITYVKGLQNGWGTSIKFVQSTAPSANEAKNGDFWFKVDGFNSTNSGEFNDGYDGSGDFGSGF